MKLKQDTTALYEVTIQTPYGSLTIDDIEATSYDEAVDKAYEEAQNGLDCSKVGSYRVYQMWGLARTDPFVYLYQKEKKQTNTAMQNTTIPQYEVFQVYKNQEDGEFFMLQEKNGCGCRWHCYGGQVVHEDYLTAKCIRVDKHRLPFVQANHQVDGQHLRGVLAHTDPFVYLYQKERSAPHTQETSQYGVWE